MEVGRGGVGCSKYFGWLLRLELIDFPTLRCRLVSTLAIVCICIMFAFAVVAGAYVFPAAATTSDAGAGALPNSHTVVAVGEG